MLGISRGIFESPPKKKQLRELLKAHTKRVKTFGGEEKEQLFCADCGLPIKDGKHRVYQSRLICSMCYWIYNLDLLNVKSPGYLIWAPELSQPEVTSFAIALKYSSEFQDTEEVSEEIESFFEDKRDLLERTIGEGTSDPTILCQFLYSLSDDDYENRGKIIKDVRLFPSDEFLSEVVEFLKTNELNKYTPERWVGLLQHVNEEMSKNNN